MTVTFAVLAALTSDTDTNTYSSASFLPEANRLMVAFISTHGTNDTPTSVVSGATGEIAWTLKASVNSGGSLRQMLYVALSGTSPTTGSLVITYSGTQTGQKVVWCKVAGANMSAGAAAAIVQAPTNSGTGLSGSITLAAQSHGSNVLLAGFAHAANENSTQRAGWTAISNISGGGPTVGAHLEGKTDLYETTASASWTTSSLWAGIAAEIQAGQGVITTDLTLITTADSSSAEGSWARIAGTSSGNPTADPDGKVEGVASLANKLGATITPTDVGGSVVLTSTFNTTNKHFFHWRNNTTPGNMNTKTLAGVFIHLSSDASSPGNTNFKRWYVEGGDTDIIGGWKCYVIDPAGTSDTTGGSLSLTAVKTLVFGCRQATAVTTTLFNHYVDVVRQGTGLTVINGNGVAPATLQDLYLTDSSKNMAWGVVTQNSGVYFSAAKINVGTAAQAVPTVFKDTGQVFLWRDFNVASGFNEIIVLGASAANRTVFQLGTYTASTDLTSSGCTIKGTGNISGTSRLDGVQGMAHSNWKLTATDGYQVTKLYNSNFSEMLSASLAYNSVSINVSSCTTTNLSTTLTTTGSFVTSGITVGMGITGTNIPDSTYVSAMASSTSLTMSNAATGGASITATFTDNNEIRGCNFSNFGAITTNGCLIDNCTFQDVKTGAPISSTYALIVGSSTEMSRITNSSFINCNRAIKITASGTYTFDNLTFSGDGYDVENSSAGLVTINATNDANPTTYINTGGGTTVINNSKTLTLTGLISGSEVRIYNHTTHAELTGIESSDTSFEYAYNYAGDVVADIVVLHISYRYLRISSYTIGSINATLPIQQETDRVYLNP